MRIDRRGGLALLGAGLVFCAAAGRAFAADPPDFRFDGLDGGQHDLSLWRGAPVLVVNTASLCGFARQFDALQGLQDRFAAQGLHVLAVPSDDFRQELEDDAAVKRYCAVNFDLTLAIATITPVLGPEAHPFYRWMAESHGFVPNWNFNKILLGRDGQPRATWRAVVDPLSTPVLTAVEAALSA
ncbi:glutathione peroxidase [Gemmobacter serpentinus]|uniref:glutathione peroxidase n=1 Tax=Gemmobacter serpentinus TaxID=2652247 RepID=UPI001CF6BA74|nr:glutathione peroxidase [Gemmobacter serpentinus]